MNLKETISCPGFIPVFEPEAFPNAKKAAKALYAAGVRVIELVYTGEGSLDLLWLLRKLYPDMIFGLSGIRNIPDLSDAFEVCADYFTPAETVSWQQLYKAAAFIPMVPRIHSEKEAEEAESFGLKLVKADRSLYQKISGKHDFNVIITDEADPAGLPVLLADDQVAGCVFPDFSRQITLHPDQKSLDALIQESVRNMLGIGIAHIGINGKDKDLIHTAKTFASLFMGTSYKSAKGYYGSPFVEIMDEAHTKGTHGHIAIHTVSVKRAMQYYRLSGFEFDPGSFTYDQNGRINFAYFQDEIAGFAIHLLERKQ